MKVVVVELDELLSEVQQGQDSHCVSDWKDWTFEPGARKRMDKPLSTIGRELQSQEKTFLQSWANLSPEIRRIIFSGYHFEFLEGYLEGFLGLELAPETIVIDAAKAQDALTAGPQFPEIYGGDLPEEVYRPPYGDFDPIYAELQGVKVSHISFWTKKGTLTYQLAWWLANAFDAELTWRL